MTSWDKLLAADLAQEVYRLQGEIQHLHQQTKEKAAANAFVSEVGGGEVLAGTTMNGTEADLDVDPYASPRTDNASTKASYGFAIPIDGDDEPLPIPKI